MSCHNRRIAIVGFLLFFASLFCEEFSCFIQIEAAEPKAVPSVNDLLSSFQKMDTLLFEEDGAFHIDYSRNKCEDVTPSRYSGGYLNVRFALAHRGVQWYALKQFLVEGEKNAKGSNIVTLANKQKMNVPLEPKIRVTKGDAHLEWSQTGLPIIRINRVDEGDNIFTNLDYFRHVGFNPAKHIAKTMGADIKHLTNLELLKDDLDHPYLPDYFEQNLSKYQVAPVQDVIDGFPCWVVEYPGMDKIWVDEKCGYAVRKRIYHWAPGQPKKFGIHNQNLHEVKPGLWLPKDQIVEKYASIKSEDKKIWDKVTSRLYYHLDHITFDEQVSDDLFAIRPTVGTQVMDEIRKIEYTITDEGVDPFAGPIGQGIKANRFVVVRALFIITGSILILFAVWRMLRNRETP